MKYGSVCDGIHACGVAWHDLGWECQWRYEIEEFPDAVTGHRWPDVPNLGDMTEWERNEHAKGSIDLLTGGTPCQSFSVAGKRGGLDDARGDLTIEFARMAHRIRPKWMVWENVPGVLSIDGGDAFGKILAAFAGHDGYFQPPTRWANSGIVEPAGPDGYGLAWRVFDAQFFGVPQRRRRVFIVGHLGRWQPAAAVLLEPEGMRGDPPPRRQAREETGPGLASSLRGRSNSSHRLDMEAFVPEVANPLTARMHKGINTTMDEGQTMVACPVSDTLGVGANQTTGVPTEVVAHVPMAFQSNANADDALAAGRDVSPTVRGGGQGGNPPAVAISQNQRGEVRMSDQTPALSSGGGKPGQGYPAVAYDMRGRDGGAQMEGPHDTANLRAASGGSSRSYVQQEYAVRRLTPVECERLQGFPDNYTRIPWRKKDPENCPDSRRYKALGNSWAVPCVRWIGERIKFVDSVLRGD